MHNINMELRSLSPSWIIFCLFSNQACLFGSIRLKSTIMIRFSSATALLPWTWGQLSWLFTGHWTHQISSFFSYVKKGVHLFIFLPSFPLISFDSFLLLLGNQPFNVSWNESVEASRFTSCLEVLCTLGLTARLPVLGVPSSILMTDESLAHLFDESLTFLNEA